MILRNDFIIPCPVRPGTVRVALIFFNRECLKSDFKMKSLPWRRIFNSPHVCAYWVFLELISQRKLKLVKNRIKTLLRSISGISTLYAELFQQQPRNFAKYWSINPFSFDSTNDESKSMIPCPYEIGKGLFEVGSFVLSEMRFQTDALKSLCEWLALLESLYDWLRSLSSQHQFENLPESRVDDIFSGIYDVLRRYVWYWSVSLVSAPVVKCKIKDSIGSSENSIFPELFQIWVFIKCLKRRFQMLLTIFGDEICCKVININWSPTSLLPISTVVSTIFLENSVNLILMVIWNWKSSSHKV